MASKFYYDTNGLTERSDLPFDGVNLRSMAVSVLNNEVVVGYKTAGAYMVARAKIGNNYTTWDNITYDIATDAGVKVLRWV